MGTPADDLQSLIVSFLFLSRAPLKSVAEQVLLLLSFSFFPSLFLTFLSFKC